MEKYERMTKKELMRIAKACGVKGRTKMNKEKLIKKIVEKRVTPEDVKKFEKELKNKTRSRVSDYEFVQLLPKEPGMVFVHWEIKEVKSEGVFLRLTEGKKNLIEIPVMSKSGSGYMRIEEGKKIRAVIGILKGGKFKKIIQSPDILVPVSKPSSDKTVIWTDMKKSRKNSEELISEKRELLEKKNKKTDETAKTVRYINVPKER